jgi:hypothetical protein
MCLIAMGYAASSQTAPDSVKPAKNYKNVVRYNISGPLLFGSGYVVLGYERLLNKKQTMSLNMGQAVLPKLIDFNTDSFSLSKNSKNSGINLSLDYRFYLQKENKYGAPRGIYLGPYYSFNRFERDTEWKHTTSSSTSTSTARSNFDIHTFGAEMGYQFVLWKRMTLDFVLIGPGVSSYKLSTKVEGDILDPARKEQLLEAVQELISEKFPGMDYVLGENEFDANGRINTWSLGYRYIIHIGFRF